jgi:uncharacterized membrane protein (DUF373 family)
MSQCPSLERVSSRYALIQTNYKFGTVRLSSDQPSKIIRVMMAAVDYIVMLLAAVMIAGLVVALYKVAMDLIPIVQSQTLDTGSRNFVIDTLSTFVILELLLGFLQYHGANRIAPTYILDAGLFFVTRELMIVLYAGTISALDLVSFASVIVALGGTRILISRYHKEDISKKDESQAS